MFFKLFVLIAVLCIIPYSKGCGSITHMLISERGKEYFDGKGNKIDYRQLLYRHNDAFQAGSIFPDAFFSHRCFEGKFSRISEDTHWTYFLNASFKYINKNFHQPWNSTTEKLVAFLFGIMSHQVSDVVWYIDEIDQTFTQALATKCGEEGLQDQHIWNVECLVETDNSSSVAAHVDFHGNIGAATDYADFAGDVLSLVKLDAQTLINPQSEWYVPTNDLYNIYKDLYSSIKIEEEAIRTCSALIVLKSIEEFYDFSELYDVVADKSPFFVDNMEDYFVGGLDDMIGWAHRAWENGVTMLEHGIGACSLPTNPIYIHCHNSSRAPKEEEKTLNGMHKSKEFHRLTIENLHIETLPNGITIQLKNDTKNALISNNNALISNNKEEKVNQHNVVSYSGVYVVNSSFAKFGWAMTSGDMDKDGYTDLIIGAPGYSVMGSQQEGRVYIVYGNDSQNGGFGDGFIDLDSVNCSLQTNVLTGVSKKQSRFGSGIAVLDINLDGILDIAIGSPAYWTNNPMDYKGLVSIYFGKKGSKSYGSPDVTVTCQKQYCNLGYNLESGDVDGDGHDDLLMGIPFVSSTYKQSGMVAALLASKTVTAGQNVPLGNISWRLTPTKEQPYGWFGYKINYKAKVLMVTSPNVRKCANLNCSSSTDDMQEVGRADIFNFGKIYKIKNTTIIGTIAHEFAGYSLDFGFLYGGDDLFMAVGYPGTDVTGSNWTQPVNFTRAGVVIIYNISSTYLIEVARLDGNGQYGGFGSLVKIEDVNADGIQDLIIGAQSRNKNKMGKVSGADGRAYIFYGGYNFPKGNGTYSSKCKLITPCPDKTADMVLGNKPFFGGNNGYKAEVIYNPRSQVILFASDIRTYGSYKQFHRSGAVHHYFMNRI